MGLDPAAARRQALLDLGGVEPVKEETRDARGISTWDTTMQDLGMDNQLKKLQAQWETVGQTEKTLMSEMAQDSNAKFQQMAQAAIQDFQNMQKAHEQFANASRMVAAMPEGEARDRRELDTVLCFIVLTRLRRGHANSEAAEVKAGLRRSATRPFTGRCRSTARRAAAINGGRRR